MIDVDDFSLLDERLYLRSDVFRPLMSRRRECLEVLLIGFRLKFISITCVLIDSLSLNRILL